MKNRRTDSRFWLLMLIALISTFQLSGQCGNNLLINQGFETVGPPCGTVPPGGLINGSFNQGCMTGWQAAWGTPSVCSNAPYAGNYFACLGANNEGFFQNLVLNADSTYCLSFYFRRLNSGSGSLDVYLASSLVNQSSGNSGFPPLTIDPSWQLLGSFPASGNQWEQVTIPAFTQVDPANTQLLFLDAPTSGLDIGIDDVKLSSLQDPDPNVQLDIFCNDQSGSTFTFGGILSPFPQGWEDAQWEWSFGDGQTATGEIVSHTYSSFGAYEVCVAVFLDCGCAYTACITLTYNPCTCVCAPDQDAPQFLNFNAGPIHVSCLEDIPAAQPPEYSDCNPATFLLFEQSQTGPPCSQTIQYTWIANDLCGNTSEITQTIIFEDVLPPQFIIPPSDLTWPCEDYMSEFLLWISDFGGAFVTDECGVVNLTVDYDFLLIGSCGEVPVDFIATDQCGNQTSMQAVFTFTDEDKPELLLLPEDLIFPCSGFVISEVDQWLELHGGALAVDDCGQVMWSNDFSGDLSADSVEIIFKAEDECFNALYVSAWIIHEESDEYRNDTIYTCDPQSAGMDTSVQVNQSCRLYTFTQTIYTPPDILVDTMIVCDPFLAGIDTTYLVNRFGCDSLRIIVSVLAISDTIRQESYTCDPLISGIDTTYFVNRFGCDSLFIVSSVLASSDTTRMEGYTCDFSQLSVDTIWFSNLAGCDSVVISSVLYAGGPYLIEQLILVCGQGVSYSDTTQLMGAVCDTIVVTTFQYVPLDTTLLTARVCNPLDTGTFTMVLQSVSGCDSTVLLTNVYFPVDTLTKIEYTCFGLDTMEEGLLFSDLYGCDSLFIHYYVYNVSPDTQFVQRATCDTSMAGIVISTIPGLICDTVLVVETTWVPSYSSRDTLRRCGPPLVSSDTFYFISADGCDSLHVLEYLQEKPQADLITNDESCFNQGDGLVQVLEVVGGLPPYLFSFNGGQFGSDQTWDSLSPGDFTVVIQDSEMCRDTIEGLQITSGVSPEIRIISDSLAVRGVYIEMSSESPFDISVYTWNAIDPLSCPLCASTVIGPITQTQLVVLSGLTPEGCLALDSFWISLDDVDQFYIPNVFSPNGDGINDRLYLSGSRLMMGSYQMMIYDRWGNILFDRSGLTISEPSDGWDGKFNNEPVQSGVFVCLIRMTDGEGKFITRAKDITLIR